LKHSLPFEFPPSPGDRLDVVEQEFKIIRGSFSLQGEINSVVPGILLMNKQDLEFTSCQVQQINGRWKKSVFEKEVA
jgi:hypothetical protein